MATIFNAGLVHWIQVWKVNGHLSIIIAKFGLNGLVGFRDVNIFYSKGPMLNTASSIVTVLDAGQSHHT